MPINFYACQLEVKNIVYGSLSFSSAGLTSKSMLRQSLITYKFCFLNLTKMWREFKSDDSSSPESNDDTKLPLNLSQNEDESDFDILFHGFKNHTRITESFNRLNISSDDDNNVKVDESPGKLIGNVVTDDLFFIVYHTPIYLYVVLRCNINLYNAQEF